MIRFMTSCCYLPGICQNVGQIRRQIKPHIHRFRNRSLDQRQNVANQLREVDVFRDEPSLPGIGHQLLREFRSLL